MLAVAPVAAAAALVHAPLGPAVMTALSATTTRQPGAFKTMVLYHVESTTPTNAPETKLTSC